MPISKKTSLALPTAALIPISEIVPEYPYKNAAPNKKNAEAYAPNKKYFRADSCDSNRRLRAKPANKYSGNENTSSATNKVIRSLATVNNIIPATANKNSGNISVCALFSCSAVRSSGEPGSADA